VKINLHIERLVLDGLPVSRLQGSLVQAAVERELARLLVTGGLSPGFQAGGAVPSLRVGNIRLEKERQPGAIGKQIADAVYGGIGDAAKTASDGVRRNPVSKPTEADDGRQRARLQTGIKHEAQPPGLR
jgi:hypothetical protein